MRKFKVAAKEITLGAGNLAHHLAEYTRSPWFDHWHCKVAHASNLSTWGIEAREIISLNLHSDT